MVVLNVVGAGITPVDLARAQWAVQSVLDTLGVRLWHAACAMVEADCIARVHEGATNPPKLPQALVQSLEAWLAVQLAVEVVCGPNARLRLDGEPEAHELQMPWPPVVLPDSDELSRVRRDDRARVIKLLTGQDSPST